LSLAGIRKSDVLEKILQAGFFKLGMKWVTMKLPS
jgi:hypothetical protein